MGVELFLNTLFHDKPDKDWILIWEKHLPTLEKSEIKISYWFDKVHDAIKHFIAQGTLQDTYVGCGTSARSLPTYRRCKANEITGIPGVWLDIDILGSVHSKTNLPENDEKALEIVECFPLKPTIIVHSGHGYQFWWVFDKFLSFKSPKMHEEGATLLHTFTWTMRDIARSMGYDIDMTFDLSRVFRVPGGRNFKSEPPSPVTLRHCSKEFYSFVEINNAIQSLRIKMDNVVTPIEKRKNTSENIEKSVQGKQFVLDPNANPPQIKFKALMDNEPKFKTSWEHHPKLFKSGDESASAYDLSLASLAYGAGWEEQEIVDLLIAFRRNNNLKPKLVESYFRRTLSAASNNVQHNDNIEELNALVEEIKTDASLTPAEKNARIEEAKKLLTQVFKTNIRRLLKYNSDPPEYKLELEDKSMHLGPVQNVIELPFFRRRFADAVGRCLPKMKQKEWDACANAMLAICEECEIGADTTTNGLINYYLQQFLEQYTPLYDKNEGLLSHRPFFNQDYLYITGPDFRKYIGRFHHENIAIKSMGIMLKDYGFQSRDIRIKKDDQWLTRSAWRIEITKSKIAQYFVNPELLKNANEQYIEDQLSKESPSTKF